MNKRCGELRTTERVKAARDAKSKTAQGFIVLLLALLVLLTAFLFVNSTYFTVGSVIIQGNKYVAVDDIYRIAGIPERINIFRLHTGDIQERLKNDLRIAEVEVTRQFPTTIIINVKERMPLAYVASSYGFVQIDKQGVVLAAFKNLRQVNVPIITGIRLGNVYVGDRVDVLPLQNALAYLAALDEPVLNQLSELNIQSPDQMIAYTVNSVRIRVGKGERLEEKAKLTRDILAEIQQRNMPVDYVDLNFASPFIKFKQ